MNNEVPATHSTLHILQFLFRFTLPFAINSVLQSPDELDPVLLSAQLSLKVIVPLQAMMLFLKLQVVPEGILQLEFTTYALLGCKPPDGGHDAQI